MPYSYLHLLVNLPLHRVRWFPAAFIFWRSAFLHLWHNVDPFRLDPNRIGDSTVSWGEVLAESRRVRGGIRQSWWQYLSFLGRLSLSFNAPLHSSSTEHACVFPSLEDPLLNNPSLSLLATAIKLELMHNMRLPVKNFQNRLLLQTRSGCRRILGLLAYIAFTEAVWE